MTNTYCIYFFFFRWEAGDCFISLIPKTMTYTADTRVSCKTLFLILMSCLLFPFRYCNSRIVKFNSAGKVVLQMDAKMVVVHSLSLDETNNKLYVADRENQRVLVFDANTGKLLTKISDIFKGPVYAVAFNPANGRLFLF